MASLAKTEMVGGAGEIVVSLLIVIVKFVFRLIFVGFCQLVYTGLSPCVCLLSKHSPFQYCHW